MVPFRAVSRPGLQLYPVYSLGKNGQMSKKISASNAKNNFGGLLEDVAVVLSPRTLNADLAEGVAGEQPGPWGEKHMIPPDLARAARMLKAPNDFDQE